MTLSWNLFHAYPAYPHAQTSTNNSTNNSRPLPAFAPPFLPLVEPKTQGKWCSCKAWQKNNILSTRDLSANPLLLLLVSASAWLPSARPQAVTVLSATPYCATGTPQAKLFTYRKLLLGPELSTPGQTIKAPAASLSEWIQRNASPHLSLPAGWRLVARWTADCDEGARHGDLQHLPGERNERAAKQKRYLALRHFTQSNLPGRKLDAALPSATWRTGVAVQQLMH